MRCGANQVAVEPQVFDVLLFLIEKRDRVVSKDDLIGSVWGGRIVSDSTLDSRINAARRAINDSGREQRLIRTTIGKGVRFVGSTREQPGTAALKPSQSANDDQNEGSSRRIGRWGLAAAAIAVILLAGAGVLRPWHDGSRVAASPTLSTVANSPATPAPRLSIVVLPFSNLSGDPDQDYFVDAITDGLTSDLSRIVNSFVIARTTAFTYKVKAVDVKEIGRALGVRYVLEGGVRRSGEDVQVSVQLIDAKSGGYIWTDRIDTDRASLVKTQDDITARLARTLQFELLESVARHIERAGALNLDAQDLVMRGWAVLYRPESTASLHEAQQLFEKALSTDAESVDARVGIAYALGELLATSTSNDPQQDMARSDQLLQEAIDRDRNDPQAHAELGRLRRIQGRLTESQIELAAALSLDRNNSHAIIQSGITLLYLGQPAESLPNFEKILQINPHWQNIYFAYFWLGFAHILLNQPEEAIDFLKKGRSASPDFPWTHLMLAAALGLKGEDDEARKVLADFLKLKPEQSSVARIRAWEEAQPWFRNPQFVSLEKKTFLTGLRSAGLPDE